MPYEFVPAVCDLAASSDVLLLSCALTDETKHLVNQEEMEALGKNDMLVNVGLRGSSSGAGGRHRWQRHTERVREQT